MQLMIRDKAFKEVQNVLQVENERSVKFMSFVDKQTKRDP
jgi:hypothetical protein